jgi:hypothetical protein
MVAVEPEAQHGAEFGFAKLGKGIVSMANKTVATIAKMTWKSGLSPDKQELAKVLKSKSSSAEGLVLASWRFANFMNHEDSKGKYKSVASNLVFDLVRKLDLFPELSYAELSQVVREAEASLKAKGMLKTYPREYKTKKGLTKNIILGQIPEFWTQSGSRPNPIAEALGL